MLCSGRKDSISNGSSRIAGAPGHEPPHERAAFDAMPRALRSPTRIVEGLEGKDVPSTHTVMKESLQERFPRPEAVRTLMWTESEPQDAFAA